MPVPPHDVASRRVADHPRRQRRLRAPTPVRRGVPDASAYRAQLRLGRDRSAAPTLPPARVTARWRDRPGRAHRRAHSVAPLVVEQRSAATATKRVERAQRVETSADLAEPPEISPISFVYDRTPPQQLVDQTERRNAALAASDRRCGRRGCWRLVDGSVDAGASHGRTESTHRNRVEASSGHPRRLVHQRHAAGWCWRNRLAARGAGPLRMDSDGRCRRWQRIPACRPDVTTVRRTGGGRHCAGP